MGLQIALNPAFEDPSTCSGRGFYFYCKHCTRPRRTCHRARRDDGCSPFPFGPHVRVERSETEASAGRNCQLLTAWVLRVLGFPEDTPGLPTSNGCGGLARWRPSLGAKCCRHPRQLQRPRGYVAAALILARERSRRPAHTWTQLRSAPGRSAPAALGSPPLARLGDDPRERSLANKRTHTHTHRTHNSPWRQSLSACLSTGGLIFG